MAGEWGCGAKGLLGAYYDVSETKGKNKYPNRWVERRYVTINMSHIFDCEHRLETEAATIIIFCQDDKNRRGVKYKFYPYIKDVSKYGEVYLGYAVVSGIGFRF